MDLVHVLPHLPLLSRSLKMPPDAIRDVLEGVLMVLGQQDTSWNNMKKFLGQSSVKDDIINYDAHKVTDEIRSRVGTVKLTRKLKLEDMPTSCSSPCCSQAARGSGWSTEPCRLSARRHCHADTA